MSLQKVAAIQPVFELLKIFKREWKGIKAQHPFVCHLSEGFVKGFLLYYLPMTIFKRKFTFTTFQRSLGFKNQKNIKTI